MAKPKQYSGDVSKLIDPFGAPPGHQGMYYRDPATSIPIPPEGMIWRDVEKNFIRQALEMTRGNQSAAARLLGITRYTLRYRMEKFNIAKTTVSAREE